MKPGFTRADKRKSTVQSMIDEAMIEIKELDSASGTTAGQEMFESLVDFFARPPPPREYGNMREYLSYRHEDVGGRYVQ